jgi:hypothetical protein
VPSLFLGEFPTPRAHDPHARVSKLWKQQVGKKLGIFSESGTLPFVGHEGICGHIVELAVPVGATVAKHLRFRSLFGRLVSDSLRLLFE